MTKFSAKSGLFQLLTFKNRRKYPIETTEIDVYISATNPQPQVSRGNPVKKTSYMRQKRA